MRIRFFLVCILAGLLVSCSIGKNSLPDLDAELQAELLTWLQQNRSSPEEYILSKFDDHDVVFLGEYHRIRHDPVLVQDLIPMLYGSGIRTLGLEFLTASDQPHIDRLLTAETYDEDLARRLFWNQWPWWGYSEYVDILEVAWNVNRELPEGAPPFRVLGLNARLDWSRVWTSEDRENSEIMKTAFREGDPDTVMAETVLREIVGRGEKGLVYSGINHAYTTFRQPVYDEEKNQLVRLIETRMGNLVREAVGDRCCTIFLHAPWPSVSGMTEREVYPGDGMIDALFSGMPPEDRRAGFDLAGSPFGRIRANSGFWSHASSDFRLEMYCDGWVFQKPIAEYEGVTSIEGWFNEENRLEAIAQIANPDPQVKNKGRSVEELTEALTSSADIPNRFMHLK